METPSNNKELKSKCDYLVMLGNRIKELEKKMDKNREHKGIIDSYKSFDGGKSSLSNFLEKNKLPKSILGRKQFDGEKADFEKYYDVLDTEYNEMCGAWKMMVVDYGTMQEYLNTVLLPDEYGGEILGKDYSEWLNAKGWDWGRIGKAIATGGLSETKPGKEVLDKAADKAQELGGKVGDALATIDPTTSAGRDKALNLANILSLQPLRLTIRAMLRVNFLNLASIFKLAKNRTPQQWEKIKKLWYQMGGNRTDLDNDVEKSYNKKPFMAKKMKEDFSKFDGQEYLNADNAGKKLALGTTKKIIPPAAAAAGAAFPPGGAKGAALWGAAGSAVSILLDVIDNKIPVGSDYDPSADFNPNQKPTGSELDELDNLGETSQTMQYVKYGAIGVGILGVVGLVAWLIFRKKNK